MRDAYCIQTYIVVNVIAVNALNIVIDIHIGRIEPLHLIALVMFTHFHHRVLSAITFVISSDWFKRSTKTTSLTFAEQLEILSKHNENRLPVNAEIFRVYL